MPLESVRVHAVQVPLAVQDVQPVRHGTGDAPPDVPPPLL